MNSVSQSQNQPIVLTALLLLILLACGPADRLREFNRQRQAAATGAAILDENNDLVAEAYRKMQRLPGYRLESRSIIQDGTGNRTVQVVVSEVDAQGNRHVLTQAGDGGQQEHYLVDGHTYVFEAQYDGWIEASSAGSAAAQPAGEALLTGPGSVGSVVQLLTEFATVPAKSGRETLDDRAATRYKLQYIVPEIAEAFGRDAAEIDLRGTLWVDDATGALLKSEILLYVDSTSLPAQEYLLEVSEIGRIEPIAVPTPVVDPAAIVAATATAEVWTVLNAKLDFRGESIRFELIPVEVRQVPDSSPRSAAMHITLRQVPQQIFSEGEQEPFLVQLREQLSLSIPERNLIITSSGFQPVDEDAQNQTLEVTYFFNADLETFGHVELIFSQPGNPYFVPVPVEREQTPRAVD
jgi:hypothetical protein